MHMKLSRNESSLSKASTDQFNSHYSTIPTGKSGSLLRKPRRPLIMSKVQNFVSNKPNSNTLMSNNGNQTIKLDLIALEKLGMGNKSIMNNSEMDIKENFNISRNNSQLQYNNIESVNNPQKLSYKLFKADFSHAKDKRVLVPSKRMFRSRKDLSQGKENYSQNIRVNHNRISSRNLKQKNNRLRKSTNCLHTENDLKPQKFD